MVKVVVAGGTPEYTEKWRARFARACASTEFIGWDPAGPSIDADYAVVWRPPAELFLRERQLKAVFNLGAGVDGLMRLPELPAGLPVVRVEDAGMARQMVEYVVHGLIQWTREFDQYGRLQAAGQWKTLPAVQPPKWPVGVMGLGVIGAQVAQAVADLGYPVAGWSRSRRAVQGVQSYAGTEELPAFLARTRVLVNVLPLTPETENILDRHTMGQLLPGGYVINVARGSHVVDEDLLALMDAGHLHGALLDVFREEPLPAEHPYWKHPKVRVTPHIAAISLADETVAQILGKLGLLQAGQAISGIVTKGNGY